MDIIADFMLASGAFGSAVYCYVLSLRLRKLASLEGGLGGAIAVLSAQVDDLTKALEVARATAGGSVKDLANQTIRAETVAARLELLVAAMHDLPAPGMRTADQPELPRRLRTIRRSNRAALAEIGR
jgi:hypothetical protein